MRSHTLDTQFDKSPTYRYDFFSGANIGVWMGSTLLSEAVGIEFSLSQAKRPVWGWASSRYDAVAQGVVQCSGMMYLNFRQAHLLTSLIDNAQRAPAAAETLEDVPLHSRANVSYQLHDLSSTQIEDLQDLYWGDGTPDPHKVSPHAYASSPNDHFRPFRRPDDHAKGFEIRITYGDYFGGKGNSTTRTLANVHVTGFGQTLEIDGKPILEVYPFFCREAR
jgi:hypothetical protein